MSNKKPARSHTKKIGPLPTILMVVGVIVLVVVVFVLKNQPSKSAVPINESAEAQLDRYTQEKKPTFAFFHSNNCHSCLVMMDTVAKVYPEFKDGVALVDVDVYDSQNDNLLRRAGINSIPTLIFIDRNGQGKVSIGVMEADVLRQQLIALKETP